ncbi:MAG: hypothetical protein GX660_15520 [Clostridiaceae bacterium]|nr:hypothetical protein [Clostridiaceae bacterium]
MNQQITTFEFKYQGESTSIDINTLLVSQFQYTAILNEIKNQLFPDIELKIKIQSFERNSFDVNQIIEITTVTGLLIFENKEFIAEIFKYLKAYLEIKKLLGDKKPDSIEKVGNENIALTINVKGNNNTVVVSENAFKIFQNNYTIHRALTKNGEILEKDPEIEGIQITNQITQEKILDIPRTDFPMLTIDNAFINKELNEKITEDAILYIKKLDLNPEKKVKWDFIFEGRKINSVSIIDIDFHKKVKEGTKFGNGDRLKCRLKTIQKLDIDTGAYIDDKFEVLLVKDIIRKDEQGDLFISKEQ